MAFAETAKLVVDLSLKGNFASQLKASERALSGFNTKIDHTSTRAYRAGQQIGTGIKSGMLLAATGVGILAANIGLGLNSLINLEKVTAQTAAVLKSTKGAAGQTAQGIRNMANSFENLNAQMDDTAIQSGANILLTFTNIRQKAFKPTLQAALDLSTAMGQDLQTSIIQIGKALSDPIKGLTSLMRIGVTFSAQQKDQIAKFYGYSKTELAQRQKLKGAARAQFDENHKLNADYKAQRVILAELNKEFGGSFLAGGQTTAGKVAKFQDAIDDLQRSLAGALLPAITNVANGLSSFLSDPQTIQDFKNLGEDVAKLFSPENIRQGIDLLKSGFGALKAIAGPIAAVVGTAVKAFTSLPPDIQKLLIGGFAVNKLTGGLVTNIAGGLIESIGKAFLGGIKAPLVNVQGGVVNVNGAAGGGVPSGLGGLKGLLLGSGIVAAVVAEVIALTDARNKNQPIIDAGHQAGLTPQEIAAQIAAANPAEAQTILKRAGMTQQQAADALKSSAKKLDAAGDGLEGARGALMEALHPTKRHGVPQPGATQHTPGDTQGGMEAQRGAMGDRLFADELAKVSKTTDIESLRGNIATGLTTSAATIGGDIETMRGSLADGLVSTQSAVNVGAQQTSGATTAAGQNVAITTASGASRIVAAVNAIPAPQTFVDVNISASSVTSVTTKSRRKGPSGGSRSDDLRDYKNGMGAG